MSLLNEAISRFPALFGLRAWRDLQFRIAPWPVSFEDEGKVHLVVQVKRGGKWMDFIRTTEEELRAEIVT